MQQFYLFLGEPCAECPQGRMVRAGIFSDEDIIEIKKSYEMENNFVKN